LDTNNQPYPNPDLIIRTSGEQRTSGLMIWQAAYAEYIFLKKQFPDLKDEDLEIAVDEYSQRQRRFGK
jgi:undecaprenyl diphosphate synthase